MGEQAVANSSTPDMKEIVEKQLREARDSLARLQAYIEPRMASAELDPVPLIAAMKRGQADIATYNQELSTIIAECQQTCPPWKNPADEVALKCLAECPMQNPLLQRIGSCAKLDWLPF